MAASDPQRDERIVELRLPSKLGYEKVAMETAASLARRMGFDADRIDCLRTAVAEAVTNAIEHGNAQDASTRVTVLLAVRNAELSVCVADQGRQRIREEQLVTAPSIATAIEQRIKGGWGIWLIKSLVDEVEFSTTPAGGNQIRMVIHLEH